MRIFLIILIFVFIGSQVSAAAAPLYIYTVNYPLKYFAEQIGGQHVKVYFPAPAEVGPAYWCPDAAMVGSYQKADLVLLNGAGYAKWIRKVSLPRSKLVDTSKSFREQYIRTTGAITHSHGPGGEHAHEDLAFTTWLDFSLAAKQARSIMAAFGRKRPGLKGDFEISFQKLEKDLLALDRNLKVLVSKNLSQPLLVSHPVYDYFSRRYNLNIKSVHWEPDEIPSNKQMMELQGIVKKHPAKWMIWEGNPHQKSVELLNTIGIESLVFDPCGNAPGQGDFLSVMQQNTANLKEAFQEIAD
jgi:zinc transport system substrate-binding protein